MTGNPDNQPPRAAANFADTVALAIEKSRTAKIRAKVTELARENAILREDYERTFGEDFQ